MRKPLFFCLALLVASTLSAQQLRLPRVSPGATLTQAVGITDITIKYSRPGVKGRQIWGGLVPFDQVWRTGANEATTIAFSDDVMINGQKLVKGTYALFTVPGRDQWDVVFNKQGEQWGAFNYDKAQDVLRVTVKPEKAEYREWMEFEIPEMTTDTAKIALRWENLAVPFTVDTQSVSRSLTAAERVISAMNDARWLTPLRAADFAFQNNRMDEAQKWLDMALKEKENAGTLWLKARMLQKQGKTADALRARDAAIAAAGPNDQDLATEIKKQSENWGK